MRGYAELHGDVRNDADNSKRAVRNLACVLRGPGLRSWSPHASRSRSSRRQTMLSGRRRERDTLPQVPLGRASIFPHRGPPLSAAERVRQTLARSPGYQRSGVRWGRVSSSSGERADHAEDAGDVGTAAALRRERQKTTPPMPPPTTSSATSAASSQPRAPPRGDAVAESATCPPPGVAVADGMAPPGVVAEAVAEEAIVEVAFGCAGEPPPPEPPAPLGIAGLVSGNVMIWSA